MRISDWSSDVCSSDLRLGKRAVQRHLETFDMRAHVTSAPPPKEKKARKKLVAAKAMESPKTICRRRRKPPEVSPKASDRPVLMMTITALLRAPRPSIDCRIDCSGTSPGKTGRAS